MPDFSPGFDPEISLRAQAAVPAQQNPIAMLGALADIRNALNQNALFQQQQAARFRLGQIMATAPNPEEALKAAQANPSVSGFIPEALQSLETSQSAELGRQQTTQQMAQSGLQNLLGAEQGAVANPRLFNTIAAAQAGVVGPAAQQQVTRGADLVRKALEADSGNYTSNLAGIAVGSGAHPDDIRNILGEPAVGTSIAPLGTGGANVVVQTGGGLGQQPTATILGQQKEGAAQGGAQSAAAPFSQPDLVDREFAELGLPPVAPPQPGPDGTAPGTGPLTGLTPLQAAIQQSEGQTVGQLEKEFNSESTTLPVAAQRLDSTYNTLQNFLAGGGADTMADFAKALQAIRDSGIPGMKDIITSSTIDKVGRGNLGDKEFFKETIVPTMMSVLSAIDPNATADARNSYLNSISDDADPRAILGALGQYKFALQSQMYKLRSYGEFKKLIGEHDPSVQGLNLDDFSNWYLTQKFDPATQAPTEQKAFLPYSPSGVLGIEPGQQAAGKPPVRAVPSGSAPRTKQQILEQLFGSYSK